MADIMLRKTLGGFSPDSTVDADLFRSFKIGEVYKATIRKPRNLKNHRRFFALCNLIYENTDSYKSLDHAVQHLKILAGHCSPVVSKATGETYLIADSISFSSMDEAAFQDFWGRCIVAVCEHILPGIEVNAVQYEIEKLVGLAA